MADVYLKANPYEVINKDDLIMLDTKTGYVAKSKCTNYGEYQVNSNLILGVCINSNNDFQKVVKMDCGTSRTETKYTVIDGGISNSQYEDTNVIDGKDSTIPEFEKIEVQSDGICDCQYNGNMCLGNLLCMSPYDEGKVISNQFMGREFITTRTIGKAIEILEDNKVKILLNIK